MYLTGVIGYPLKKTLSPFIHNKAFEVLGLKGRYFPLSVPEEDFGLVIETLKKLGFCGFNVTNPYKVRILKYLDGINKPAKDIGAVNTVKIKDRRLFGFNTDVLGFIKSIRRHRVNLARKKILLIGAGGVARAIIYAIVRQNPEILFVANRTKEKTQFFKKKYNAEIIDFAEISRIVDKMNVVINATSVDAQYWIIPYLNKDSIFYDTNYQFPLMRRKNIKIIDGTEMLVYQAAYSFSIWTQKRLPLKIVLEVIKRRYK
ncbi:MAG: shikimate dehydrogenase [candidate division WOR-3 bacterium]|nr:shikimate dehydrogenase [candidate division WOR-3 bacterium]